MAVVTEPLDAAVVAVAEFGGEQVGRGVRARVSRHHQSLPPARVDTAPRAPRDRCAAAADDVPADVSALASATFQSTLDALNMLNRDGGKGLHYTMVHST